LLLFGALLLSCPPVPDANDILLANDRVAPVITLDAAPSLEYTTERVQITGQVCDTEAGVQSTANLEFLKYYIEGNTPDSTVNYNPNGNFLVNINTLSLPQEARVIFEVVDKAGNKGKNSITLLKRAVSATPQPTNSPTLQPTPQPSPPDYVPGNVWFEPKELTVANNSLIDLEVHLNSGTKRLAAYGIDIGYAPLLLKLNTDSGTNGITAGINGFVGASNHNTSGTILISGFDITGKGPGSDLHLLTIHFSAIKPGTATVTLKVNTLTDENYNNIGTPQGVPGSITVQ